MKKYRKRRANKRRKMIKQIGEREWGIRNIKEVKEFRKEQYRK